MSYDNTLQSVFDRFLSRAPGKPLAVLPAAGDNTEVTLDESIPAYNKKFCSQEVTRLDSSADHRRVLKEVFEKAQKLVFIVSPFLTWRAIEADHIDILAAKAVQRGVKVVIITDSGLNKDYRGGWKSSFAPAKKMLEDAGAFVKVVSPIHNKTLCVDGVMICEGSYNWLSAVRTAGSEHKRLERSIMYCGKGVSKMIKDAIREIGGIDQCNGGGIKMNGVKAQKIGESGRYFHMTKKYPILMGANIVFSVLIGRIGEAWQAGVGFMVVVGLIILGDYLVWNKTFNKILARGILTEKVVQHVMDAPVSGTPDYDEVDLINDPQYLSIPGNVAHKD